MKAGGREKCISAHGDITRRDFLKYSGIVVIGVGCFTTAANGAKIPISQGYLLIDTKKCQGCMTESLPGGYRKSARSRKAFRKNLFAYGTLWVCV